jgi:amino acid adenylation domain-containing protein
VSTPSSLLSASPLVGDRARWYDADVTSLLLEAAEAHAERPALISREETTTYRELFAEARAIAALLTSARAGARGPSEGVPTGAVMGSRTRACFAALLGTILSGATYVPLNPKFPAARNAFMLRAARVRTLAIESADLEVLVPELTTWDEPLAILVLDASDAEPWRARLPTHRVLVPGPDAIATFTPTRVASDTALYVMFTSGSTGAPKGVVVSHTNVLACLAYLGERYQITADDRFSQNFDLTFDLSVFDLFLCWVHGASLHVAPSGQQAAPARFIESAALTIWFSVPSMALLMDRFRMLNPGAFPTLRFSLFCGERLPLRIAEAWQAAAPTSAVENLYGPTEATIACTLHRFGDASRTRAEQGGVPIGVPFDGMRTAIVDAAGHLAAAGESGELWLSGPQLAAGYLEDEAKTAERFVRAPWDDHRWYRTGDVARVAGGELIHLGRMDDQVKIRGYRIELGEVETALRAILENEHVAVVAVAPSETQPAKLVGFVVGGVADEAALRTRLAERLPDYMHPAELVALDTLPLNSNGKVDKKALLSSYGER